jgi:hypothetical protein
VTWLWPEATCESVIIAAAMVAKTYRKCPDRANRISDLFHSLHYIGYQAVLTQNIDRLAG